MFSPFSIEMRDIIKGTLLKATNGALFFVSVRILAFAAFLTRILKGHCMDAEVVFVTMAIFNVIRVPVCFHFPNAIAYTAEAFVTISRIQVSR